MQPTVSQVKNYVSNMRATYDTIDVENSANIAIRCNIRKTLTSIVGFCEEDAAIIAMKAEVEVNTALYEMDNENFDELVRDVVIVFYRSVAKVCGYDYNLPIGKDISPNKIVASAVIASANMISIELTS